MNWIKRLLIFAVVLLAAFGIQNVRIDNGNRRSLSRALVKAQSIGVVPRTVWYLTHTEMSHAGSGMSSLPDQTGFRAVRSDGSYVWGEYRKGQGQEYLTKEITFVTLRKVVTIMDAVGAIQTFTLPETSAKGQGLDQLDPSADCQQPFAGRLPAAKILGRETMLGYDVVHFSR